MFVDIIKAADLG